MKNQERIHEMQLDAVSLEALYGGDTDHMLAVFEQFLDTSPTLMREVEARFSEGLIEPFRQKVHKIKPIFSYVGMPALTTTAEAIERRCHSITDIAEVETLFLNLSRQYQALVQVIEKEIGSLQAQNSPNP